MDTKRKALIPVWIILGILLGGLVGAGVGIDLYPPLVGIIGAALIGLGTGLLIRRSRMHDRS